MTDLGQAINSLDIDESIWVIILCGSGQSFCGVDFTSAEDVFKGNAKDLEPPIAQMEQCKKSIIGAINGFAVTTGFEIALACDILVASKDAKFMDTHVREIGSGSWDSWFMPLEEYGNLIGRAVVEYCDGGPPVRYDTIINDVSSS